MSNNFFFPLSSLSLSLFLSPWHLSECLNGFFCWLFVRTRFPCIFTPSRFFSLSFQSVIYIFPFQTWSFFHLCLWQERDREREREREKKEREKRRKVKKNRNICHVSLHVIAFSSSKKKKPHESCGGIRRCQIWANYLQGSLLLLF